MSEAFEQFVERMGKVGKDDEIVFGRAHEGNSRAIFHFDGHYCLLESFGYRRIPDLNKRRGRVTPAEMMWVASAQPSDTWVCGEWVKGKKACEDLAKRYGGRACPDEYHEDDKDAWYLRFDNTKGKDDGFEKLMRLVWDYKTGVLPAATFPWKAGLEKYEI